MKHINLTNWRGSITDWTKLNYIYGGLDDTYAVKGNLRIDKDNYNYVEYRESKNLFDVSTIRYNYWAGSPSSEPTNYSTLYIPVKPSTRYYISGTIGTYHLLQCYDADKTFISTLINNTTTRTFTTPNSAYYIMYSANTGNGHNNPSTIMISEGSSALPYEPYFEGKKYVITEKLGIVDLGTLNWISGNFNATYHVGWVLVPGIKSGTYMDNTYCRTYEKDSTHSHVQMANKSYYVNNRYINLKNTDCATASELKTALNNVMLIFELETPVIEVVE